MIQTHTMTDRNGTLLEIGDWVRFWNSEMLNNWAIGTILETFPQEINRGLIRVLQKNSNDRRAFIRNHEYIERIPDEEAMLMALENS